MYTCTCHMAYISETADLMSSCRSSVTAHGELAPAHGHAVIIEAASGSCATDSGCAGVHAGELRIPPRPACLHRDAQVDRTVRAFMDLITECKATALTPAGLCLAETSTFPPEAACNCRGRLYTPRRVYVSYDMYYLLGIVYR